MSDETSAPAGGEAIAVITPAADAPETFSLSQAANALSEARNKKPESSAPVEQPNADPVEPPELSEQDNGDPATDPAEDPDAAQPELPPLEPPRSWTQAEKERFQSLPRETQEYLSTREQEREREFRRGQNEIAEKLKGVTAKEQAAEQARQQYESKIKSAMEVLEREQLRDFPDIKTFADVERMAAEDPFRKIQWDTHQQKMQVTAFEAQQAESRKATEQQTQWSQHVQKENALAAEYIPELADKVKGPALTARAADRLSELGFKPDELAKLASGQEKLSLYDHRIQRLIFSDLKLSDIQSAPKAVVKPNLPPVQRPGTAKPAGSAQSERIQALERQSTFSLKSAQELLALKRSGRR